MAPHSTFFKDKHGDVVLYQPPNLLLILFIVFSLLQMFASGDSKELFGLFGFGFGIAWSYLEAQSGVNGFRKTLGFVVITYLILSATFRIFTN